MVFSINVTNADDSIKADMILVPLTFVLTVETLNMKYNMNLIIAFFCLMAAFFTHSIDSKIKLLGLAIFNLTFWAAIHSF